MRSAALSLPSVRAGLEERTANYSWGYGLFVLTTAVLFLRPSELVESFEGSRLFLLLILACLAFSLPLFFEQLSLATLSARPINACVVGLWISVMLSHLAHCFFWGARTSGVEFAKLAVYYLLLISLLNTPERLTRFTAWLLVFIVAAVTLPILQDLGIVNLSALQSLRISEVDPDTGETMEITRLRGTGIFNDPNDLALIIVLGVMLCVYFMFEARQGVFRLLWLAPLALLVQALAMTMSRGGLLSFITALNTLVLLKFGWKKALIAAPLALGAIVVLFGGRMTDYESILEGTGQSRIQIWSESLTIFRDYPLFGLGHDTLYEEVGQVAHNSFLHCFVELGFFGGSFFLGAFGTAIWLLYRLQRQGAIDSTAGRILPYLLAALVGYTAGLLSLSRAYIVPTYLVLGLAAATVQLGAPRSAAVAAVRFNAIFLQRLMVGAVLFVVSIYVFIRLTVRW